MNRFGIALSNAGQLQVKRLITNVDQEVDVRVGSKFSLRQWLRNIGREYDPMTEKLEWNFSLSLGRYEVYEPKFVPMGTEFRMLELAVLTTTQYAILSTDPMFRSGIKIRQLHKGPEFKYFEIQL